METDDIKEKRRKRADYMREWNRRNPEKVKITREKRKEYFIKYRKQYYSEHSESIKEVSRRYYQEHKKEILLKTPERVKEWELKNPDRTKKLNLLKAMKRRAKVSCVVTENITSDQLDSKFSEYNYRCAYCYKKAKLEIDHIIPIHKGGSHTLFNIVPACRSCNARKSDRSLLMFLYDSL